MKLYLIALIALNHNFKKKIVHETTPNKGISK